MNTLLITGATGYIGSKLCEDLSSQYNVIALVRETPTKQIAGVTYLNFKNAIQASFELKSTGEIYACIHLASLFIAEHTSEQVAGLIGSNLGFATEVAELCKVLGIRNFINTGTSWQRYDSNSANYNPVCLYAASKEAYEKILYYYHKAEGFSITNLHIFDSFGPGDTRKKLFHLLKNQINNPIPLNMSAGEQHINLVHVDDIIQAFKTALHLFKDNPHPTWDTFGVFSDHTYSLKQVVSLFEKTSGCTLLINWGARAYRNREVMIPNTTYPIISNWECKKPLKDYINDVFN